VKAEFDACWFFYNEHAVERIFFLQLTRSRLKIMGTQKTNQKW